MWQSCDLQVVIIKYKQTHILTKEIREMIRTASKRCFFRHMYKLLEVVLAPSVQFVMYRLLT